MKRLLLLLLCSTCYFLSAQTTLGKGDIMVLGVNVNQNPCDDTSTDLFHLILLTAIEHDTEFLITDNRWYGGSPPFNRNEGVILVKRTGGDLPAGSIVSIKMTDLGSGGQNNQPSGNGISPGWSITKVNNSSGTNNAFALNNGGDQLLIWQGTWDSDNPGNITGELLFAYNSKNIWTNTSPEGENSLIPPELYCYNATPFLLNPNTTQNFPFRHYNGPTTNVSKGEWQIRILNVNFWTANLNNCTNYNNGFNSEFPSTPVSIRLQETPIEVCEGEPISSLSVENHSFVSYEWFISETPDVNNGTLINSATLNTYIPTESGYYYCAMTINIPINIQNTIVNNSCTFYSNIFEVTIHPNPITSPVIPL